MVDLNESTENGYAGMSGMTAYNHVKGDFFLSQLPAVDSTKVKQTIQGVVDEFVLKTDAITLQSILPVNQEVNITESVYQNEVRKVVNKSLTSFALDAASEPFNRIVIQAGAGEYNTSLSTNVSSTVHDEIVALAVEDPRPFMIKGLDTDHTADLVDDKPTNDAYIHHLTPSDEPLIASIKSPSILTSSGGPDRVLVFYDAIDLTGEVVAGTGLAKSDFNTVMDDYYSGTSKAYLVVRKTIPAASTVFSVSGTPRTLSDILLKPYTSAPSNDADVQLEITAPGGLVSIPSTDFKRPISSHTLKSYGQGGKVASPFIDVSDCLISKKDSILGYGRPRRVDNPNTPDQTSNPSHHVMVIAPSSGSDHKTHSNTKQTPAGLSRSSMQVFNIIDNTVSTNDHEILVVPSNRSRYAVLDDFLSLSESSNPPRISIEISLLNGRAEEFNITVNSGDADLEIRGRSKLMDLSDRLAERDLDLGEAIPIKEIGDLGTPTAAISLGGLGQGGMDSRPIWDEHTNLKGWKDRIIGSGNPSVRNDSQTSTHYASTRALVEIPLFPSMFYDVEKIHGDGKDLPHPVDFGFKMTVDATMTAANRPQAQHIEGKNAIDWGMRDTIAAVRVNSPDVNELSFRTGMSMGMRVQNNAIQAVVASYDLTLGTANSYIQVDDTEAFVNEAGLDFGGSGVLNQKIYITIGEGIVQNATGQRHAEFFMMRIHKIDDSLNRLYPDQAFVRGVGGDTALLTFDTTAGTRVDQHMFTGAVLVLGGVICNAAVNARTPNFTTSNIYSSIRDAIRATLGNTTDIQQHNFGTNFGDLAYYRHQLITISGDRVKMSGLEFDVFNEYGGKNDVYPRLPIECIPYYCGLKGVATDNTLQYVVPQEIDFRDVALKVESFDACVNEIIRTINQSGHENALNRDGKSAFDTWLTTGGASGSHMGYVRAFLGSPVESKDGEEGHSIVIHSTVPGAAGRNFAVWFENRSSYPYRPVQAFGHGGLLATNSRSFQGNSHAAPMPIDSDGKTFPPITTFTGAPHGRTTNIYNVLFPNVEPVRTYDGIGSRYIATTTALGASDAYGTLNGAKTTIDRITIDTAAQDYIARSLADNFAATGERVIIRINNRLATAEKIEISTLDPEVGTLTNVRPYKDAERFFQSLFDNAGNEIVGLEVEFLNPLMDKDGILFFGGGHTGVVFDVSDGTANDYSDKYTHPFAKGPTGFSGFQNLGDFMGASAVLDFTNVRNEDTINDNTFRGFHHKDELDSSQRPRSLCRMFVRCVDNAIPGEAVGSGAHTQDNTEWREEIYNRKVRTTTAGFSAQTNSLTQGTEITGSATSMTVKSWFDGDVVALFNNNAGTITAEHGDVRQFDPRASTGGADWGISAVIKPGVDLTHFTGPILHGIYDAGVPEAYPWGIHVSGNPPAGGFQEIGVAITNPSGLPIGSPILASVIVPLTMPSTFVKVSSTGYTFIMAGRDGTTGGSYCYIGNTVGITNPADPGGAAVAGIFDFTPYMVNVSDDNYGVGATGPNARPTFDTESNGYGGGVADHPDVPAALQTIRDKEMATIGCALIGAPHITLDPTMNTQGGTPCVPYTGYFDGLLAGGTYGTINGAGATGTNSAGPIHFAGFLSEVALWRRAITFTEATSLWAGRAIW